MTHQFDVVDSEIVLEAPIIAVRHDQVQMPGGDVSAREVVKHFGIVTVVAVDEDNRLYLLNQQRQAAGKRLVELPAGLLDVVDKDLLEAVKRELVKGARLETESWSLLTDIFSSPGFAEEAVRIYLARGLRATDKPKAHDEEADMAASWTVVDEAVAMTLRGEIPNGIALSGIPLTAEVLLGGTTPRSVAGPFDTQPMALAKRRTRRLGTGADLKRIR